MAEDPAVLFYTSDFLSSTFTMSDDHVGKYIRLLCIQHQRGHLSESDMLSICKTRIEEVYSRFLVDENGCYYQKRMERETLRRKAYTASRRENLSHRVKDSKKSENITYDEHMSSHMTPHMGHHMETETETTLKEGNNDNDMVRVNNNLKHKGNDCDNSILKLFDEVWGRYPKKLGKKEAERHYKATVKSKEDYNNILLALEKFLSSKLAKGDPQYIPHGSTWFNNWKDWLYYEDLKSEKEVDDEIKRSIFRNAK